MEKIKELLEQTGALQFGHFVLPDGKHTDVRFRMVKIQQFPPFCRKIAYEVVKHYWDMDVQLVVASSADSILFAGEIARQLEARVIFTIQPKDTEKIDFYPNFSMHSGDRVLLVDDVLLPDAPHLRSLGRRILNAEARLIGIGSIVDASGKTNVLNVRQINAFELEQSRWESAECPLCADEIPLSEEKKWG